MSRRVRLHSAGWMKRKADQGKQARRTSWLMHQLEHGRANCTYCNRRVSRNVPESHPIFATVDHIIPVSAGGYDGPRNWAVCCNKCNQAKADKALDEFMERGRDDAAEQAQS
jgi:5-methylcytosine-specific restriction endonuclease McrA